MSESGKGGETPVWTNNKQKMIRELKERDMYEDGMTLAEMKSTLDALHQSLDMANPGGQNKNINKTPEVMRHENQPCYSRVLNSKASERTSMSPELSTSQFRKSLSQEKRGSESSDDSIFSTYGRNLFGKDSKDVQPANINKTRLLINENTSETTDNKLSGQRTNSQKRNYETPKCRVNPLGEMVNANDIPLQSHYRTLPEKDCADVGTSVNFDKAFDQLTSHLQRIAELWHSHHGSSVRARGNPWGKAIQVGTDNGSLDEESVPEVTSEDAGPSETNVNVDTDRRQRACARKIVDYTAGEVSDSNSDDVFEQSSSMKRKKTMKRAGSSENTSLPKVTVISETTKRRKYIRDRDDVYEWEATKEDKSSDEELQRVAKKKKLMSRAGSSEKTSLWKEAASSETTRSRKNVANSDDIYEWEAANKETNSDEELQIAPKKKKVARSVVPTKKAAIARSSRQKSVEPVSSNAFDKQDDAPVCLDDSDEIMICDNGESDQTLAKPQRSRSEEAVSSTSSTYPRRIIPPIPKGKYSGIRARRPLFGYSNERRGRKPSEEDKEDDEDVTRTNRNGRSNSGLQDSEIAEALETVGEEEAPAVDLEIRPLQVSSRMKLQQERLRKLRKEEEQLELQRAEEQRMKEERITREKEERIKQRLQEQKDKIRREEQVAKAKAEAERRWSIMKKQGKKRQAERSELNSEGLQQNSDVPSDEAMRGNLFEKELHDVEVVNDERRNSEQNSKRVSCPICGKMFPAGQIEDHAASCEEYDATSSTGASRSSSPAVTTRSTTSGLRSTASKFFECTVCSVFTSTDGRKYEDHVNTCVTKARDGVSVGSSAVVDVPDSPIRGLRRVSELTDSDINYKGQFIPKTKSHISESKKRKRI